MNTKRLASSVRPLHTAVLALGVALAGVACGDDANDDTTSTTSTTTTSAGSTTAASTSASSTSSSSSSSGTGGGPPAPTFVAELDASQGQLAEGLFVKGNEAYVGMAALGTILRIDLPGGAVQDFGSIPAPPANSGFLLGIVVDGAGDAFVGFGGGPGDPVKNGIYKIPAAGGAVTLPFAENPEMNFPNGLWLDASNDIYVADSGGAIFRVAPDGTTTKWKSDPSLVGTDLTCANAAPFPIGANGIVRIADDFYVSNTNLGEIVKIPILGDGTAGAVSIVAGPDCAVLGGIDGIAADTDGASLLAVSNSQNQLLRIDPAGNVTQVFAGKPLDNPASVFVSGTTGYITNSSFFDQTAPTPGLLSLGL